MKNLSVMEQKRIAGGKYRAQAWSYETHQLVFEWDFDTYGYAKTGLSPYSKYLYHKFIFNMNTGEEVYNSED
ncbi:hypothetical protein [[Clostridium] polysaccharolyticum]|uniref:Uncharacterized protein n=1 Tax=[Clostridium] polysaccharolyticum TaxID=29364 RepID=A0A1H9Z8H2_9FIRM|nr:hypothetical protein [[Clostridium] polysaccharolyticum]SES77773.1 hypothetical protein SAMN04487772_10354 [[Clostridium] polysaccharolyticum]